MKFLAGLFVLAALAAGQLEYSAASVEVGDASVQQELAKGALFVNFCVPFLAACKEFVPVWNAVAAALETEGPRVAHMNVMENHLSKARFRVMDFPALILVKDGMTFKYPRQGEEMGDWADIVQFARSDFDTGKVRPLEPIPHLPQMFTTHDYVGTDGKVYPGARF